MIPGNTIDLKKMNYLKAYELQKQIHQLRWAGAVEDTLLFVEHSPVYTIGQAGGWDAIKVSREYLKAQGVEIHQVDRGGSVTFHGPGQIVGYPIFHLDLVERDLHQYIRFLEEAIILTLAGYGIQAGRLAPHPGVWVGQNKIAAVGVGCKKWVTYHGFALNVQTDLRYFELIDPCGIKEFGVTSMSKELNGAVSIPEVQELLQRQLEAVFGLSLHQRELPELFEKQRRYAGP